MRLNITETGSVSYDLARYAHYAFRLSDYEKSRRFFDSPEEAYGYLEELGCKVVVNQASLDKEGNWTCYLRLQ